MTDDHEDALKAAQEMLRHTWPCGCEECQRVADLILRRERAAKIKALTLEWAFIESRTWKQAIDSLKAEIARLEKETT